MSDSTGPGVSSESQIYGLAVALWKSTNAKHENADQGGATDDQAAVALERALLPNSARTRSRRVVVVDGRVVVDGGGVVVDADWSGGGGITAHSTARSFGH